MNLFDSILNKAQQTYTGSSFYKGMESVGSKAYDWANTPTQNEDVIQKFLDDSAIDTTKKRSLLQALNAGEDETSVRTYLTEKYYPQAQPQFRETLPMVQPTFPTTGREGVIGGAAKMIGNAPTSLYNLVAGGVNIGSTAIQEGVGPTASMLGKGIIRGIGQGAESVSQAYQQQGLPGAISTTLQGAQKTITQDPALMFAPQMIKGAGVATKAGGKALVKGAQKIPTPKLPKAEELLVTQLEKTNRMNPTKYGEFEQMAGQRAGKFLADRGITGDAESNVAKLYENFTKSKAEADKGLGAIQKTYKASELPSEMTDMLGELQKRFTYTKDTASLKTVSDAIKKAEQGALSHSDINAIKRLYERKVKVNYIKDQNSLEVERATNIDDAVRKWQFDEADKLGFSNLRDINKETQLSRYLADNIGDKITRQAGLNNISLTDWIIAGQVPATPQALALLAGKKFAQNAVPKLYQKGLEKVAKIPKKEAPVADIANINKMETIRKSVTPQYDANRLLVSPRTSSQSPRTITPEVTLPKGEKGVPTTKSPVIKSDITSKSKIVRPSSVKPSPQVKLSEKTVNPTKKSETNITRNEAIEKGFSNSAKARWNKGDFTMKERGEATKYLKSNYKGKEYMIDGKKYKVDAIDNRNEKVRLVDSEGNIIRVKINKLPETKVTDKDIFDYYNGRVQKGYKTILSPTEKVLTPKKESAPIGDMETKKLIPKDYKYIKKYGASSNDINIDARKGLNTEQIVGLSDELRNLPNFEGKVIRTSNSVFGKNISDIKVGDILSDKGFLSSSKTKSKVWGDYGDYEIIINSKTGKDITKIKGKIYDKYEPEILFDRNVKFVVKNIKGNKIYIEEI